MPLRPEVHAMDEKQQSKPPPRKQASSATVCFLCGREGHYGSPTSCYAAKHVRKTYFN